MNYWGFYIFTKFRHSKNTCNSPLKNRQQVSSTGTNALFSRRFRRKTRLLQRLVFFRLFNAIGPLFVHYVHSLRLSLFFRHCETVQIPNFFPKFFYCSKVSPYQFLQQNGCSKNPKGSPCYIFRHYATYRRLRKFFSSILSYLRASVVSSCRKSGFRVLLSLRYGADLLSCQTGEISVSLKNEMIANYLYVREF